MASNTAVLFIVGFLAGATVTYLFRAQIASILGGASKLPGGGGAAQYAYAYRR